MTHTTPYAQSDFPCLLQEEEGEWVWVPKKIITPAISTTPANHQTPKYRSFSAGSVETQACALSSSWAVSPHAISPTYSPLRNDISSMHSGSPTESILEGFDTDLVLRTSAPLENMDAWWTAPALDSNAVSSALFTNMDWMDPELFSGLDLGMVPELPLTMPGISPSSSVYGSQSVSDGSITPLPPLTPPSLPSPADSPASYPPTAPALSQPLQCFEVPCTLFSGRSGLRSVHACPTVSANHLHRYLKDNSNFPLPPRNKKHERKHRQPSFYCPLPHCGKGHSDKRALARHLWAQHPDFARESNTRSEKVKCSHPGCPYEGRKDNFKRHMQRHEKKGER
ncbi:hypothetical protein N657DRAFT_677509 [Parathielavia appendiculata]|uniref:C2H2-type domain-containing protein n=1 Tax=Parathielavia appendiculata TaxID=2587402 RepID=A0AAN6U697_9PEZI|nr:hypothetical protein N657DRAFT_677509 [Parathielavia appendiculata]